MEKTNIVAEKYPADLSEYRANKDRSSGRANANRGFCLLKPVYLTCRNLRLQRQRVYAR